MNIQSTITENTQRRKAFEKPYNPISGFGDTVGERKAITFKYKEKKVDWNIPVQMLKHPFVELVVRKKSLSKLAEKEYDTEKNLFSLMVKIRCKYDFEFWAASCAKIQDKKSKKIIPFVLNKPQRKLLAVLIGMFYAGIPIRVIIDKARQWGGSTLVQLFMQWLQIFHFKRWHSIIATDVENQARTIRSMFTRVAKNHPKEIASITIKNFEGSSKNKHIVETDTIMSIGSMQQPDNLRSQDIAMAHLCMHPHTEIPTKDGFTKFANEIQIGDAIITHNGNISEVTAVTKSKPTILNGNGEAFIIKCWGQQPITLTPNHPIYTKRGWVNAENITKTDYLSYPVRKITDNIKTITLPTFKQRPQGGGSIPRGSGMVVELNKEIGFAFGYYLAEGNVHVTRGKIKELSFCSHDREIEYNKRAVNALFDIVKSSNFKHISNTNKTVGTAYDAALAKYIYENFKSKENKTLPDWFFDCGKEFLEGVLTGYLSGDGSKSIGKQGNYELTCITATSISSSIAFQIRDIAVSLGLGFASVDIKEAGVHFGRNCKKAYILRWAGSSARNIRRLLGWYVPNNGHSFSEKSSIEQGFVWIKVKDITKTTINEVVDVEVSSRDHSFRTISFSIKNSELGLWKETEGKKPEDLIQTIVGSILFSPGTVIVQESTAKGVGNYFHRAWQDAVQGKSNDVPVFVAWYEIDMYQKDIEENLTDFIQSFTDYEKFLWESGATLEGINWYRSKIKEFRGDTWRMQSEYPTTPDEAFQSDARRVFSPIYVKTAEQYVKDPILTGELSAKARTGAEALQGIQFAEQVGGNLKIWIKPEPYTNNDKILQIANRYCAFLDIGGRTHKADYSVLTILDRLPMLEGKPIELAARWRGHTDQDILAWLAAMTCKWYDNALLGVEVNSLHQKGESDHSFTILDEISDHYDNLFHRTTVEDIQMNIPRKWGFHTNKASKEMILDRLNAALREGSYTEHDREAINEFNCFEEKPDGSKGAVEGAHDDIVISTAGAVWLATSYMDPPKIIKPNQYNTYYRPIVGEASF